MPTWLRVVAEWNPVSALTAAGRDLWGNGLAATPDAAHASPGGSVHRLVDRLHGDLHATGADGVPPAFAGLAVSVHRWRDPLRTAGRLGR
jgi:hypothetical protein